MHLNSPFPSKPFFLNAGFESLASHILALLDNVNRGHEIEICPSSVRPSLHFAIISEPNAHISFKFRLFLSLCSDFNYLEKEQS